MKVKDVSTHTVGAVVTVTCSDTITSAVRTMKEEEIGSVLVYSSTGLRGIFTERDLAHAIADGADPNLTEVREYMTESPLTIVDEASFNEAVAKMDEYGLRHIPVIRDGDVEGMLSARDVIRLLAAAEPEQEGSTASKQQRQATCPIRAAQQVLPVPSGTDRAGPAPSR